MLRATASPEVHRKFASTSAGASNLLGKDLRRGTKQGTDYNKLGKADKITYAYHSKGNDEIQDVMYRDSTRGYVGPLPTQTTGQIDGHFSGHIRVTSSTQRPTNAQSSAQSPTEY